MGQERTTKSTPSADARVGTLFLRALGVTVLFVALAHPVAALEQGMVSFAKGLSPDTVAGGGTSAPPFAIDIHDEGTPYEDYIAALPPLRKGNGSLKIYVWNDGDWDAQGSLAFDKFYREQQIRLDLQRNNSGIVRMKLVKEGGGSAHIDAALLGGKPATGLSPESPVGLAKLSARDFDVLHGFESDIELHRYSRPLQASCESQP